VKKVFAANLNSAAILIFYVWQNFDPSSLKDSIFATYLNGLLVYLCPQQGSKFVLTFRTQQLVGRLLFQKFTVSNRRLHLVHLIFHYMILLSPSNAIMMLEQ
jgi:hypothetical protein